MSTIYGLHHAHLFCADLPATIDWWVRMFDARVAFDGMMAGSRNVFMTVGEGRLHLYAQPPRDPGRGAVHHLGVRVADLPAVVRRLRREGATIRSGIREFPLFRYVMTAAPDNVLVEVFEFFEDRLPPELSAYFDAPAPSRSGSA